MDMTLVLHERAGAPFLKRTKDLGSLIPTSHSVNSPSYRHLLLKVRGQIDIMFCTLSTAFLTNPHRSQMYRSYSKKYFPKAKIQLRLRGTSCKTDPLDATTRPFSRSFFHSRSLMSNVSLQHRHRISRITVSTATAEHSTSLAQSFRCDCPKTRSPYH
jgi:hypothetical protein